MSNTSIKLSPEQQKMIKQSLVAWKFRLFLFSKLPMGWLSGMKVHALDQKSCTTTVPYKWLNKNPFNSMYFAVMAMAAELSTGVLALLSIEGQKPSIATIIIGTEAEFFKKATERVYFTCEDGPMLFDAISQCKKSNEAISVKMKTEGKTKDGTLVAIFHFTWSFKLRKA